MRSRILILITLTCVLTAAVASAAVAGSERRSDIPACEELLTLRQAAAAMGEPYAFIVGRAVDGSSTRRCDYGGGATGAGVGHAIDVSWGPYADYRKRLQSSGKKFICPVSKDACRNIAKAVKAKSNRLSFAFFERAVEQVGSAKPLQSAAFEGNPAILWVPDKAMAPLDELSWMFVYISQSASLLAVSCADNVATTPTPDTRCAIAAAKTAYNNVS